MLDKQLSNIEFKQQKDILVSLVGSPIKYTKVSALMAFFPISIKKAKKILFTEQLRPVSILRGSCVLGITIFDFLESPVGPYREIALSIPVMWNTRIRIPFLPLIFDTFFKNFGFYSILLAMNTNIGREHAERIFGYPTFPNNVEIDIRRVNNKIFITSQEKNKKIFSIENKIIEKFKMIKRSFNTFLIKNNKIIKVTIEAVASAAYFRRNSNLIFTLGDHEISNILNDLEIQGIPLEVIYYNDGVEILNPPEEIGKL